jgi:catechol 2,3-dioxygenase-like lactoylglutathione lyase family enzyme
MISHIFIGITDFQRAFNFYRSLMDELGCELRFSDAEKSWAGWQKKGQARPLLLIGKPYDGEPASVGNGHMLALLAPSRNAVDACYRQAIALGASCEGKPGLRPHYHANYYGAYFCDLDGNKLCICCHEAEG